jgi:hypothetical protein
MLGKELEGDNSLQLEILGLIDDAHAAFTELLEDLIMRDSLSDHTLAGS